MKKLSNIFKLFSVILCLSSAPILVVSCSSNEVSNISDDNNSNNKKPNTGNKELKVRNYFTNQPSVNEEKGIKTKIKKTIDDYRLYEWNEYYSDSKRPNEIKASVFNFKWTDFSKLLNNDALITNPWIKKGDVEFTSIYQKQDEQFRYFNDFINIINNEEDTNQEDFLYLRWLYYSCKASRKYHSLKLNITPIYKIRLQDWMTAIIKDTALLAAGSKPTETIKIIKLFLEYYNKSEIIQTFMCAKDLMMRFSTKPESELNKNKLWKLKTDRANKIYKLSKEKFNLLADSFTGDFVPGQEIKPGDLEAANGNLNVIKDGLMKFIELSVATSMKVELENYYEKDK